VGVDQRAVRRDPVEEAVRQWAPRYPGAEGFRALTSLVRSYAAAVREVDRSLRPLGLTLSRFEILLLLSFSRGGRLPMMRIRDLLLVHGSRVTYLVGRLEEAGLVRRGADPDDRRVSLVSLTEEGNALVERAAAHLAESGFGVFAALDEERLAQLGDLLGELRREPAAG
jgi:DNA-binding MarR family transcriptional regulator